MYLHYTVLVFVFEESGSVSHVKQQMKWEFYLC